MSNSPLVNFAKISPNSSNPRNHEIDKITIHHVAGITSVETLANIFAPVSRGASSNYGIGNDGRIGLFVEEKNRAWTSNSTANDDRAITIEVSNSEIGGEWKISDAAMTSLIALCVDICKRNSIKKLTWTGDASGNLTVHRFFAATACPGPYLFGKMPWIAQEVNKRLEELALPEITYQSFFGKWGLEINSKGSSYSGDSDHPISGIRAKSNVGKIYIQSCLLNTDKWLGKCDKYVKDGGAGTGYSGQMYNAIERVRVYVEGIDPTKVEYRGGWSGKNGTWGKWIKCSESDKTSAGKHGICMDRFQIRIVK